MPDARAVRLWEKIRMNLLERGIFEHEPSEEVHDEQIKAIEYELGVGLESHVYGAPDSTTIGLSIDRTIPAAPVIIAMSGSFHRDGGKGHIRLGEALAIEYRDGRLHIAKRPVTW